MGENCAFVTDKVLKDNRYQFESDKAIILHLEQDLKRKVIIIPAYPGDKTGHADGLIRFVDETTVLINKFTGDEPMWEEEFTSVLAEHTFKTIEVPCVLENNDEALYVNYLHVGNLIVVPQFDSP